MSNKTKEKQESKTLDVQKAQPLRPLSSMDEMDRLFDHFFSKNWLTPFNFDWPRKSLTGLSLDSKIPNVDIIDRDNEIVIRSEVPGVAKDDLEVTMTDNTVTIKGKTKTESKEEDDDYYRHEITQGSFSRTLSLPCDVISEETKSTFKDGVLELVAPKSKAVKRHTVKL